MKTYLVYSKGDDYGRCRTELVQTTPVLAKEYYHHQEVLEQDGETLKRYIEFVDFEQEQERTETGRFYGES